MVAGYHEAKLAELVAHVAEAIDRFRGGEFHAIRVDEVPFQYSRRSSGSSATSVTSRSPLARCIKHRRSIGGNAERQDTGPPVEEVTNSDPR